MADVTRRQFLRNASVGAAAAGAVAVTGVGIFTALDGAVSGVATGSPAKAEEALAGRHDVFAHVTDARAGEITIFYGTKAVRFTNRDLAQQLLHAAE